MKSTTRTMSTSVARRLRDVAARLIRPAGPLPRPTRGALAFDAVLALVLGVAVIGFALDRGADLVRNAADGIAPFVRGTEKGGLVAAVALAAMASAPLALRRAYPLTVLWIVTAIAAVTPHDAQRLVFYACVIAAYSAAAHSPYRAATLASLPVMLLAVVTDAESVKSPFSGRFPVVPDQYVPLLILVPLVVATIGLRTWRLRAGESRARMSALELQRAGELRRATEEERARIARELHDVVTHNVSVMVIQAGAARTVMDTAPDQARDALLAVEAGGRAALAELRHAIGLLTMGADTDDPADGADPPAPQPGLDGLAELVGRVRDAGLPVDLAVTGRERPVPPGAALAAYRVVQEALTNTVKHAPGASATVTVEYAADHLRIEAADTGGTPGTAPARTGNGRGLTGLRERLAVYNGTLRAGPRPGGGYRVTALIPLEAP